MTLAAIAEDSGGRLITQAELLANATDVDSAALTATGLTHRDRQRHADRQRQRHLDLHAGANDDTAVSFCYTVTDGALTRQVRPALDITPVNDAPTTTAVTLAAIAEDSGGRLITQAELLGNATDVDSAALTATGLSIATGNGSLIDNGNGTWTYTPALNDDGSVSFSYTVTDGVLTAAGPASLDITPVNDAPTTTAVTLTAIAEDSGGRLITQAELLGNATDVDSAALTATGLSIATGNGSLTDNGNGTWTYTPALNDDGSVSFSYTVTDGVLTAAGSASLDITPVNDAPTTTAVTLTAIAEDSGGRVITQAELLGNATDVDSAALTATGLSIATGNGSLTDNGNGTWTYTPALNDDGSVSFSYTVTDGVLTAAGSASLDITPVNDAPTTTAVTLTAIAEDSGGRVITQAELLGNATDVDSAALTATGLSIATGNGSLTDNGNGTWTYTPALNDDGSVSFSYTVTDGVLTAAGSASLDITPVNDAPTTTAVTLTAIAEDSGGRVITQAELLGNATDVDSAALTATGLSIATGNGSLIDNGNGTWTYTPALNDDGSVSFSYTVTDGVLTAAGSASLDITPVNDAPTTTAVTLTAIAEDSGGRVITQAELLGNATDVDSAALTATGLSIATGNGSLTDNGNGTWTYTPALNDDGSVSFSYTVTDGVLTAAGSASLDITPVNDAPTTTAVTLTAIAEDSGGRVITQAELLGNATDVDSAALTATGLSIATGNGSLTDNGNGTWTYTPALNDDGSVSFSYTVTDGVLTAAGSASLDITPVNGAPTTTAVTLTAIAEDSGGRVITQAELLGNATDVDSAALTATGLSIATGNGSLTDNGNGTWTYTPALNDDGSVSFSYTVTDGVLTAAGSASLDITPVNDAPTDIALAGASVAENATAGAAVGTLSATDIDQGDSASFTLVSNAGGRFALANGNQIVATGTGLDFETATSHDVVVRVTDAGGLTREETFAIAVTDVAENTAPTITSNGGGNTAAASLAENTTLVATLAATDPNAGDALTFSIGGGEDAGLFELRNGNQLHFRAAPDFESLPPSGATPGYQVEVQVTDGHGGTDTQALTVAVQNVAGITQIGNGSANTLTGTGEDDTLSGLGGNDTLRGLAGNDVLLGGDGNDTLDGGAGRDTMTGGAGNDTYEVDSLQDVVVENPNGGNDTIRSALAAFSLVAIGNVENFTFVGSGNFTGTGNVLANTITGGAGNDTLNGGAGADRLVGLGGNDYYFVDSASDVVVEAANGGIDTVMAASASYNLSANVENLTYVGAGRFNGDGNGLNNTLTGGPNVDTLSGEGGNDTLIGFGGNDALDGGGGDDTFLARAGDGNDLYAGGSGNDTYSLAGLTVERPSTWRWGWRPAVRPVWMC